MKKSTVWTVKYEDRSGMDFFTSRVKAVSRAKMILKVNHDVFDVKVDIIGTRTVHVHGRAFNGEYVSAWISANSVF